MTIDEAIAALKEAKSDLGGDYKYCLEISCDGNTCIVDINNIIYSKLFGLRCEISPPWFMYSNKKSRRYK